MSAGAGAAAAAAAAAAELQRQEEEEMTPYSTKDLDEGWEFKIVRSNFATFRSQEKLRAVLEEEKRGGWMLVEKFDDQRIRLKRPPEPRRARAISPTVTIPTGRPSEWPRVPSC